VLFVVFRFPILLSFLAIYISDHCFGTWGPLSWADFTELISILEGLYKSQDFINVSANWKIINADVSHNLVLINDVGGSECNSIVITVINKTSVFLSNLFSYISNKRNVHLANASLLSVLLSVLHVSEMGIDGSTDNFTSIISEVLCLV